jgi:hypothetical protein
MFAMESPENWFEDFGLAQLQEGVASVAIDPDFLQTVNTETGYHVFLTPNGNCLGLYVANKTPTGFEVRELSGGKSDVAFDYRIVARRRGHEGKRMPDLKTAGRIPESGWVPKSGGAQGTQRSGYSVKRPTLRRSALPPNLSGLMKAPHVPSVRAPSN